MQLPTQDTAKKKDVKVISVARVQFAFGSRIKQTGPSMGYWKQCFHTTTLDIHAGGIPQCLRNLDGICDGRETEPSARSSRLFGNECIFQTRPRAKLGIEMLDHVGLGSLFGRRHACQGVVGTTARRPRR